MEETQQFDELRKLLETKEDLHPELRPYFIKKVAVLGWPMIKHPLIVSLPHFDTQNALINKSYLFKKDKVQKCLEQGEYDSYIWMHERHARFDAFIKVMHKLDSKQFWKIFGGIWTDTESQYCYLEFIRDILKCNKPHREFMMDEHEQKFLKKLPDEITVFRGHQFRNKEGCSWSLSYNRAKWFAARFADGKSRYGVIAGTVKKSDVIAVLLGRGEMEIAVDPSSVFDKHSIPRKRKAFWYQLFQLALSKFSLGEHSCHNENHWEKVEHNAMVLSKHTKGADKVVTRIFALIHDCMRENEDNDPDHGLRAAQFADEQYHNGILKGIISEQQLNTLKYACEYHDKGLVTDDPTVGCCWDADRLDLMRVKTTPDPKYLSTAYGKTHVWNI